MEAAFEPGLDGAALGGALQLDGKMLVAGAFTEAGGLPVPGVVRLHNNAGTATLRLEHEGTTEGVDTFRVIWALDAPCPAGSWVALEGRTHGGGEEDVWSAWSPMAGGAAPVLKDSGWELGGLALATGGAARGELRACLLSGDGHSCGCVEELLEYEVGRRARLTQVVPVATDGSESEVPVEDDNSGTPVELEATQVGVARSVTFVIRNLGLQPLTFDSLAGSYVELSGTAVSQWSVEATGLDAGGVLSPLAALRVVLTFTPTERGEKAVMLRVVTDDAAEPELLLHVSCRAIPGPGTRDGVWQQTLTRDAASVRKNLPMPVGALAVYGSRSDLVRNGEATRVAEDWLLVGGDFEFVRRAARKKFAQVFLDTLGNMPTMNGSQGANHAVYCAAVLPGGGMMLGGAFTTIHGKAAKYLAKLNRDGSLDSTFRLKTALKNGQVVRAMAVEADGNLLLCVDPAPPTKSSPLKWILMRVASSGVAVVQREIAADGAIHCLAVQKDGAILVGGEFSKLDGASCKNLVRLNSDLSRDTGFNPTHEEDGAVRALALLPKADASGLDDVLVAVAGVGVQLRKGTDGALYEAEPGWLFEETEVTSMVVQANRSIVVVGPGVISRYLPDGSADTGFVTSVAEAAGGTGVYGLAQQADGAVLVCGGHSIQDIYVEGGGQTGAVYPLLRLQNDPAPQGNGLQVLDTLTLKWVRTGAVPDAAVVSFECSEDGGQTWKLLSTRSNPAVRAPDGWLWAGTPAQPLPPRAVVRVRARLRGGHLNGCDGLVEELMEYPKPGETGLDVPDLAVTMMLNGSSLAVAVAPGGSTLALPSIPDGSEGSFTLKLTNTGNAPLTGLAYQSSNAALLDVQSVPGSEIGPRQSMSVVVTYRNSSQDNAATLILRSNVPGIKGAYAARFGWQAYTLPRIASVSYSAASLTPIAVQLVASVVANDAEARVWFEVSVSDSSPVVRVPASGGYVVRGFGTSGVTAQVSGLLPATTYRYRALLQNSGHVVSSTYKTFKTKPQPLL